MKNEKVIKSYNNVKLSEAKKEEILETVLAKKDTVAFNPKTRRFTKAAAIAAMCIVLASAGGVYAAVKWLTPKQVAIHFEEKQLAEQFGNQKNDVQMIESGDYKIAYLGTTTKDKIKNEKIKSDKDISDKNTYVVAAIAKKDGSKMTENQSIMISPLIGGTKPWQCNVYSMHGGRASEIIDGVLYCLVQCDNVEIFANHNTYLAVSTDQVFSSEAYDFDLKAGTISPKKNFKGLNCLFDMKLDPTKADEEAVKEYFKNQEAEVSGENEKKQKTLEEYLKNATYVEGSEKELIVEEAQGTIMEDGVEKPLKYKRLKYEGEFNGESFVNAVDETGLKEGNKKFQVSYSDADETKIEYIVVESYENGKYIGRIYRYQ